MCSSDLPHVKCFIEQNYNNPTSFNRDKKLMSMIRLHLQKNDSRYNYRPLNRDVYSSNVDFKINESDFNHYGHQLSNYAIMEINKYFENKLKHLMRTWCSAQFLYGTSAVDCVREFQLRFGYSENIWKFESIYKDCQRNNVFVKETGLSQQIHKIVLSQMSKNRTLTQFGKNCYEEC